MKVSTYSVDAVEAEHIGDETTPRVIGKNWRVAFYKDGRLYAVMPIAFSKGAAVRAAQQSDESMSAALEQYVRAVATVVRA